MNDSWSHQELFVLSNRKHLLQNLARVLNKWLYVKYFCSYSFFMSNERFAREMRKLVMSIYWVGLLHHKRCFIPRTGCELFGSFILSLSRSCTSNMKTWQMFSPKFFLFSWTNIEFLYLVEYRICQAKVRASALEIINFSGY